MGDIPHDWKWKLSNWWWEWESSVEQAFIVVAGVCILLLLLTGCSTYALPYIREPTLTNVCVNVHWTTQSDMYKYCPRGATACTSQRIGAKCGDIWSTRPEAFDDYDAVYMLGHEFLHRLDATHK